MSDDVPKECCPRKCHVVKWPEFQGYGFNLHAEKGKAGQFIGKVDDDSPAEASGLKEGDRIVEVNGVNIGNENHQQVVTRIKSGGDETTVLVVDTRSDNYYKEHKKVIRGDQPEVIFGSAKRGVDHVQEDNLKEEEEEEEPTVRKPQEEYFSLPEESDPEPDAESEVAPSVAAVNGVSGEHTHHQARHCHLRIWPTFQGYGFNLHAERDKPGQFIGLVDDNSPASTAGLKVNDRIVEVNCVNVEGESHMEVIARIKAVPNETKLLVLDREADLHFREKGVTVSSSMPEAEYIASPESADALQPRTLEEDSYSDGLDAYQFPGGVVDLDDRADDERVLAATPAGEGENGVYVADENGVYVAANAVDYYVDDGTEGSEDRSCIDLDSVAVAVGQYDDDQLYATVQEFELPPPPAAIADYSEPAVPEEPVNSLKSVAPEPPSEPEPEYTVATKEQAVEPPKPVLQPVQPPAAAAAEPTNADALEMNLSVAEMKERLKAKKRQDPRLNKMSFEQKYKEFQRM